MISGEEQLRWLRHEVGELDFLKEVADNSGAAEAGQAEARQRPRRTGGRRMLKIWAWRVFCAERRAALAVGFGEREEYKTKANVGLSLYFRLVRRDAK